MPATFHDVRNAIGQYLDDEILKEMRRAVQENAEAPPQKVMLLARARDNVRSARSIVDMEKGLLVLTKDTGSMIFWTLVSYKVIQES